MWVSYERNYYQSASLSIHDKKITIRMIDELPNHWLIIVNKRCICNSFLNLEHLTNGKEEDDKNNNNNDDCNNVDYNNIGHYNNAGSFNNNRLMLSK